MLADHVFSDLGRRLHAKGLPEPEIHQFLVELRDHRNDLMEEGVAAGLPYEQAVTCADKRLGGADQLVKAAICGYRKETFLGRHPFLFFGFAPMFAVFITVMAFPVFWLFFWRPWLYANSYPLSPAAIAVVNGVTWTVCVIYDYIIPSLLALLFYRAARGRALARFWCIFPCLIFTLVAAWLKILIHIQYDAPHGVMSYGLLDRPSFSMGILPLVTVLIWAWFASLRRRDFAHL